MGLDQAQDLGPEVLAPVRPPQAAAGDHAETQMDALDPRAVDEYFAQGPRQGEFFEGLRIELEGQAGLELTVGRLLIEVCPQHGVDGIDEPAQDAVFVGAGDSVEAVHLEHLAVVGERMGDAEPLSGLDGPLFASSADCHHVQPLGLKGGYMHRGPETHPDNAYP